MIDRVQFENFKSLVDVSIDLARLTALVGPNGCGKSSVLQGIHLLSQTANPLRDGHPVAHLARTWSGPRAPRRFASASSLPKLRMHNARGDLLGLSFYVPDGGGPLSLEVDLRHAAGGGTDSFEGPLDGEVYGIPAGAKKTVQGAWDAGFGSVVFLHLDAREMVRTSVPEDEEPRMGYDGAGLASTLAWMKGADEDALAALTSDLASIIAGVRRIVTSREWTTFQQTERLTIDGQVVRRPIEERVLGDRFAIQYDDGNVVPADLLSEGTVLTLGLLAKLREPRRPKLFLLDDIDRGLHPSAQAQLVDTLRRFLTLDPELQIVCTTHSPYLLDKLAPEEIRILSLDPERRTRVMPLTRHPDYEKWRYGIQTGEMWTTLGESWVVGAPAA